MDKEHNNGEELLKIVDKCVKNLRGWNPRADDPEVQKWFKHFILGACVEWAQIALDNYQAMVLEPLNKELAAEQEKVKTLVDELRYIVVRYGRENKRMKYDAEKVLAKFESKKGLA